MQCGFGAIYADFGQIWPNIDQKLHQDAVLVRSTWILAKFGRILTKNSSKIEVPRGTGILLRFKTASQLINEIISGLLTIVDLVDYATSKS